MEVMDLLNQKHSAFYFLFILFFLVFVMLGNDTVTVLSEKTPLERKHSIIIDAGHGGVDGGATSCTGRLESTYNLQIALRLNDLLHLLGYDTVMIRSTDVSVYTKGESISQKKISDLKERVRIVDETPNGILLSIHQNNFSDSRYSGAQVFYSNNDESQKLAEKLQTSFISTLNPGSRRQIKRGEGIYLLEKISRPGVLIECGFLSNAEEETKLSSEDYQKKLCCVIAASLCQYLSNS